MQAPSQLSVYISGPLAFVRSGSNPNLFYGVGIDPHTQLYVCECPDHRNRRRDCKHIKSVQAGGGQVAMPKPGVHGDTVTIRTGVGTIVRPATPPREPSTLPRPTREEIDELWAPTQAAA